MAIEITDESYGTVSTVNTVSIQVKEVTVTYEVDIDSSLYYINVDLTFRQNMSNNNKFLYLMTVAQNEVDFDLTDGRAAELQVYDTVYDGAYGALPSADDSLIAEVSRVLTNSIMNTLNVFGVSIEKVGF